jgi:flagellar protein FliL
LPSLRSSRRDLHDWTITDQGDFVAEQKKDAAPAAVATPAPAAPGGKPILFIGLAIFNMLVVAAVGAMIYLNKKKEAAEPKLDSVIQGEKEAQEKEKENPEFIGKLIPLETFLVNLSGSRGQKLAKINMELEVNNDEVQKEIEKLKPKIRDIIIIILSSKAYAQVATKEGKDALREEIRDQVNLFLTKGKIARVYFTEFIYN